MSLSGFAKIFIIGSVGLILCIALFAVLNTVSERSQRRIEVHKDLAKTTAGDQIVAGPFLVFPYRLSSVRTQVDAEGAKQSRIELTDHARYVLPKRLGIMGSLKAEPRYRGLYEVLLYNVHFVMNGDFEFEAPKEEALLPGSVLHRFPPYLVVLIRDNRGLVTAPLITWNNTMLPIKPGRDDRNLGLEGGFRTELPDSLRSGGPFKFSIEFSLLGTQSLSWVPVGEQSQVSLEANWPHPSFVGRALPQSHQITPEGFKAVWKATQFSSDAAQLLSNPGILPDLKIQKIGVELVQPVDIYLQTERAVKYGFLLIGLTFATFLGLETVKRVPIHPIQYTFVGLALVLFYVLLLALSEHIAFSLAYGIASFATVSLLGYYVRYVVGSWKTSIVFGCTLALLDGILYAILMSEDYALLYGSLLLLTILSAVMIGTHRVDWNRLRLGDN